MSERKTLHTTVDDNGAHTVTDNGNIRMSGGNPTPVDHLLASLAGCAGLTLRSILQKQRVEVEKVTGEIRAEYEPNPYRFRQIRVHLRVAAENLGAESLDTALNLMQKHCPVHTALSSDIDITYTAEST